MPPPCQCKENGKQETAAKVADADADATDKAAALHPVRYGNRQGTGCHRHRPPNWLPYIRYVHKTAAKAQDAAETKVTKKMYIKVKDVKKP